MTTTPLAPWLPYNRAALAPLRILMLSISSGLIAERPSPVSTPPHIPGWLPLLFAIGIPSITNRGELSPLNDLFPLRTILVEPPAPEVLFLISTPAALPAILFMKLGSL